MPMSNSAFLFIKPEAVNDAVKELVEQTLKDKGMKIKKKGELKSEVIDKKKLIDNHYYAIASKATILKPKELNVPADKFKGKFGLEWQAALDSGKVFNAMDGCEFLGVDSAGLDKLWAGAKKADKLIKFGGGFYCGDIEHEGKKAYIFNGFFMSMRAGYVVPGKSIFYYVIEWDAKSTPWSEFRAKVCGVTDPAEADAGSLRGQIFAKWEDLKLDAKPNVGQNSIHASASPFEGLSERMNWLGYKLDKDAFGTSIMDAGLPAKVIKEWSRDPQVDLGSGKMGSCFDALEDMDASDCLDKLSALWMSNRPPLVGKVSGAEYKFDNKYSKLIKEKDTPSDCVYSSEKVMALIAGKNLEVFTKEIGYPTFLDMPANKSGDLTGVLPKLGKALKEATGATSVAINCKGTGDHPVFTLEPTGGSTVDKEKFNAALNPPKPLTRAKFMKVGSIKPGSKGLNLGVKALSEPVEKELKNGKAYEVQVGDASGVVTITLREEQKGLIKNGKTYELRNAAVQMVKGHVMVMVDKWGKIAEAELEIGEVKTATDVSATEYELRS